MTGPAPVEESWSPRKWTVVIGLLVAAQVLVAWQLSDDSPVSERVDGRTLRIRQAYLPRTGGLSDLLGLIDPTLLVMPSPEGFSGAAWLALPPMEHRSDGWSNPPQWLQFNPSVLLEDLGAFGRTNRPVRTGISDRLSRRPEPGLTLSAEMLPRRESWYQLTGDVGESDLQRPLDLPVVPHSGILAPSVIALSIDERGRVFSESLISASGNDAADLLAREKARALRFGVRPGFSVADSADDFGRLRQARLTIHWWTSAPDAVTTNAAPDGVAPLQ